MCGTWKGVSGWLMVGGRLWVGGGWKGVIGWVEVLVGRWRD